MKLAVVKHLASNYEVEELEKAESDLTEEKDPQIEIEGEDEGEKLTHAMAAIWVKKAMQEEDIPLAKAVRNYTQKVRSSIS